MFKMDSGRWRPFNPNPLGLEVGDCTVRTICAVTGLDWDAAHKTLCDLSRVMGNMPSADKVWWELLRWCGFTQRRLLDTCPDCYTVERFAEDHPRGVYVLGPQEHAVALIDGEYWDAWDSGRTVPSYYFKRI